jgi:hypothetical protein
VARQPEECVTALQHRLETALCVVGLVAATVIGVSVMARLADARPPASHHQRVAQELRRLQDVAGHLRVANRRLRHAVVERCCNAPTPALAAIAACESGGRTTALSPGGTYRGKYQFAWSTWRGMGGRGDPAAAPEPEQDYRAWLLYQLRGSQPWPVCGRGW